MSPMTNSSARKRHENTTPKETPMTKHPETTTEWLEDIALELHAITGLLNERLPEPPEPVDVTDDPDDEPMGVYRRRDVEALRERAEKAEAQARSMDDAARRWKQDFDAATNRAEKAEAERDERADDLEGLLQAARADRDTWEAAYKRVDDAYSRARDERDTALANQKVSAAALQGALKGGHEWHRRYEALQEGIRGGLNESREMQAEVRSSVTLAYLQSALDELLDPTGPWEPES